MTPSKPDSPNFAANVGLAIRLRIYVDEWLATGVKEDGSERPFQRNLGCTPQALLAVTTYMERYPATVDLTLDSYELSVYLAEVDALPSPSGNPYYDIALDATRLFVGAMASDWRWHLCKCRHCGRYFLHPKPRQSLPKGNLLLPAASEPHDRSETHEGQTVAR